MAPGDEAAAAAAVAAEEAAASAKDDANGGASAIDLLAAAAEDTLRTESRDPKKAVGGKPGANLVAEAAPSAPAKPPARETKSGKRKRKGANEPKNPLGAFVCKFEF